MYISNEFNSASKKVLVGRRAGTHLEVAAPGIKDRLIAAVTGADGVFCGYAYVALKADGGYSVGRVESYRDNAKITDKIINLLSNERAHKIYNAA